MKPRLPGEMCTLTSCCAESACHRSNKTTKKRIPRTSISEYNKTFSHSAHGVCVLQNTLVCFCVCVFVDTKTSTLIEIGQHMSSISYVRVRNRKIFASRYLTNESVHQGAKKSRIFKFFRSRLERKKKRLVTGTLPRRNIAIGILPSGFR